MSALLATLVLVATAQTPQQSLLREIVPNPTGRNGYEEYLMACDTLRGGDAGFFSFTTPSLIQATIREYESLPADSEDRPSESSYRLAKKYGGFTQLQLYREALKGGATALAYIEKGNRKPVSDPRRVRNWATTFPEYISLRSIGRLAVAGAYVGYADGNSGRATQYLMDAFEMGQKISGGVLIARLVGISIQSMALAAIEKHLPMMSAADAKKVVAVASDLLPNPPLAEQSVRAEFEFLRESIGGMFDRVDDADGFLFTEERTSLAERTAYEFYKKMTPADRQQVIRLCRQMVDRQEQSAIAVFRRPESDWDLPVETDAEEFPESRPIRNAADFADYLSEMTMPSFVQVGAAEIRNRTQIRLLRLTAQVVQFKWEHDRLPSRLDEAVPPRDLSDPVSKESFQYEQIPGGFRVYSKGTPRTGDIGLKYVRQQADPGVPPPTN